ncbi:MAG: glycosyltransferase family 4 protein [Acholeplasma sp.]|nr:glycosyltransferase family 4 protein [Acholeplasma sp.]
MLNYEYPPIGGGAGQVTLNISKRLAQHHNITVVTAGYHDLPKIEKSEGITIFRINSKRKNKMGSNVSEMLSWVTKSFQFCSEYLTKNKIDIIFTHFTMPGGEVALRLNRKFNIPYVIMSHGHDIPWFFPEQMFLYHFGLYFRIRQICRKSSALFLQTPEMKVIADKFTGKYHKNKNIVIPNACDTDFFANFNKHKHDKLKIIYTGRFVMQKQPVAIIKALRIVKASGISFEMNFIGDGPLLSKMQNAIINNNLQKEVKILGWKTLDEIKAIYANANLFVMPSKAEGMSVAIIEAMASGLYVLTSNEANKYNIVKDKKNGFVIKNVSAQSIADEILNYNNDFFLSKTEIPVEVIQDLITNFNWDSIVNTYLTELKKIGTS